MALDELLVTLNLEKVYAKFRDITESIEQLQAFRRVALEAFLEDRDGQQPVSGSL
ncbi:MAG: hypothetical protein JRJ12_09830 [Deltaproteobacteria bacterium]|nr:hypothetical protein [Deltaproteobacteria bacterium]MBW2071313.1 hypothetical protein [Deltaproteobacteria bacterium]